MLVLLLALLALPLHSEPRALWQSGVLHGVGATVLVIIFKVTLACMVDARTLRAMYLPSSDPVFCFGALRWGGFRLGNLIVSEVFSLALLHLCGCQAILPPALRVRDGPSAVLLAFLCFMFLVTFFGVAVDYRLRQPREQTAVEGAAAGIRLHTAVKSVAAAHDMSPEVRSALQQVLQRHQEELAALVRASKEHHSMPSCCNVSGRQIKVAVIMAYFVVWSTILVTVEEQLWRVVAAAMATLACALPLLDFGTDAHDTGRAAPQSTGSTLFALAPTLAAAFILRWTGSSPTGLALATLLGLGSSVLPIGKERSRRPHHHDRALLVIEALIALCPPLATLWEAPSREDETSGFAVPRAYLKHDLCGCVGWWRCRGGMPAPSLASSAARLLVAGLAANGDLCTLLLLSLSAGGALPSGSLEALGHNPMISSAYACASTALCMWACYKQCTAVAQWRSSSGGAAVGGEGPLLATIGAGAAGALAAVFSCVHLSAGWGSKMYFDIAQNGYTWFVASIGAAWLWREAWAYGHHQLMHYHEVLFSLHSVNHAYRDVPGFSAVVRHPLEAATLSIGAQLLPFILPVHPAALLAAACYSAFWVLEDASPRWSLWPRPATSLFHADHHTFQNCNFGGSTLFFDFVFGTLHTALRPIDAGPNYSAVAGTAPAGWASAAGSPAPSRAPGSPVPELPAPAVGAKKKRKRKSSQAAAGADADSASAAPAAEDPRRRQREPPQWADLLQHQRLGIPRMEESQRALPARLQVPPLNLVSCRVEHDERGLRFFFVLRAKLRAHIKQRLSAQFKRTYYPSAMVWVTLIDADGLGEEAERPNEQLVAAADAPRRSDYQTDFSALYM